MKYYKIKDIGSGVGIQSCIKPVDKSKPQLVNGFIGRCESDDLPFGYVKITDKNGLWIEVRKKLVDEVEEIDYDTCIEYEKVI